MIPQDNDESNLIITIPRNYFNELSSNVKFFNIFLFLILIDNPGLKGEFRKENMFLISNKIKFNLNNSNTSSFILAHFEELWNFAFLYYCPEGTLLEHLI